MRLNGKVAVITGGADGIGQAAASAFVKEGARVVIADIQAEKGSAAARELQECGGDAMFIACDVSKESDVRAMMEQTVERYGTIDVLVNNAAVAIGGRITEMAESDWRTVIDVNLSGVYRGCKYAMPSMLNNGGGSIINVSSVQAYVGFDGWTAYAAAKGGIIGMTRQLAVEFAPYGIRVNSISPGTIHTPMNEKRLSEAMDPEETMRTWISWHPMGRVGRPKEAADAILFLASDESSFITGIDLLVDGGLIRRP